MMTSVSGQVAGQSGKAVCCIGALVIPGQFWINSDTMRNCYQTLKIPAWLSRFEGRPFRKAHASNPEPLSTTELAALLGDSPGSVLDQALLERPSLDYVSVPGDADLRAQFAEDMPGLAAEHLQCFAGAQEAIHCVLHALVDAGDRVLCFTPIFEPLLAPVRQAGGEVVALPINRAQRAVDFDRLEAEMQQGCRVLISNFPHNPTGFNLSAADQQRLIDLCERHDCWLFSDEVFRGMEHDPDAELTAAASLYSRAISLRVFSKAYALPAIRIAWIGCRDQALLKRCIQIRCHLSICGSRLDELLAMAVWPHREQILNRNRQLIKGNLQQVTPLFEASDRIEWIAPQAGATAMPILDSSFPADEVCKAMLEDHGIGLLPAHLFETDANGIRIGLGMRQSADWLAQFLDLLGGL